MQMPRRSNNTIDFPDKAASGSGYNLTLPEDHPQSEQERRRRAWIHKHPIRITEVSCRWLEEPVRSTLEHFAALAARSLLILSGPRQAGQEELFGELMPSVATVDLDDPNSCSAAQDAPKTFLSRNAEKTVLLVLNAHRAPALLNVLIQSAGLTDAQADFAAPKTVIASMSAELELLKHLSKSECIRLLRIRTLAQGELTGISPNFADRLLRLDFPSQLSHDECNRDLILEIAMHGGYPGARQGTADQCHDFFHQLIRKICKFDLAGISRIKNPNSLRKVYRMLAATNGEPLNLSLIASVLDIGRPLARDCVKALEALYLVEKLPV